jgi:hypothetical protein
MLETDDFIAMLTDHCHKLVVGEDYLYQKWEADKSDLQTWNIWLQTQHQLRISAIELDKRQKEVSRKVLNK